MRGIDISHFNGWPFDDVTAEAYEQCDFVIVKATQGAAKYKYVNYFEPAIRKALADGKLAGAYHYAAGKAPEAEADYFLSVVGPYVGKIILALDWEEDMNAAYGSKTWCKRFIDHVKEKTGVICFLYTGMDEIQNQVGSLANDVPLWFAGYPQDKNTWVIPKWPARYDISPWKQYTIWQYTSGDNALDRDYFPGTRDKWLEWCKDTRETENSGNGAQEKAKRYSGDFPELPSRGYYNIGDGYRQLPGMVEEIKKLQRLVNWINGGEITVDGKYGPNTAAAVELAQTELKVKADGLFGSKTLLAAKGYMK